VHTTATLLPPSTARLPSFVATTVRRHVIIFILFVVDQNTPPSLNGSVTYPMGIFFKDHDAVSKANHAPPLLLFRLWIGRRHPATICLRQRQLRSLRWFP